MGGIRDEVQKIWPSAVGDTVRCFFPPRLALITLHHVWLLFLEERPWLESDWLWNTLPLSFRLELELDNYSWGLCTCHI